MLPESHRFIILHALQFSRKHFKGYEKDIENGCVKEDHPSFRLNKSEFQIFGFDHFYNPKLKTGYLRFLSNAKVRGLKYFDKALKLYKKGNLKEAFFTLGRSTHYLMDVASPSHTKLLFHLADDDFENYVEKNIHKLRFRIKSRLIRPFKPGACFERLAKKSYRVKYKKSFLSLFIKKTESEEKKLNKTSKKLVKFSIIYTIALLNAFHRRMVRHNLIKKEKKFVKDVERKIIR